MKIIILHVPAVCVFVYLYISPVVYQDDRSAISVNGKYSNPLRKLFVPDDYEQYGGFYERCCWFGSWYVGYDNVSVGYLAYIYPH